LKSVGVDNYIKAFQDEHFQKSLVVTFTYAGSVVPLDLFLGLCLALLVVNKRRFATWFRITMIIPTMMAPVSAGYMFRYLFFPKYGLVDSNLIKLGLQPLLLTSNPTTALLSVMLVDVWQFTPFSFFILLSGLMALPPAPLEAAEVDGASKWQIFRNVTLPLMKPIILVVILLRLTDAFKLFDQVFVLTRGGPGYATHTLGLYLYRIGLHESFYVGYASAMSWVVNIIVMAVAIFLIRMLAVMTR